MTVFQDFFGRANGLLAEFAKKNPTGSAVGDELVNSRKIDTFKSKLSTIQGKYDLFELKTGLIGFRNSLFITLDPSVANANSKELSNQLTDLINSIDPFMLFYSALETRVYEYIISKEGTWGGEALYFIRELHWVYTKKVENERASGHREPRWILELRKVAEEGFKNFLKSSHLLPELHASVSELPEQDYFEATETENSQAASRGHTFTVYEEKINELLREALATEKDWETGIQNVQNVLTDWPKNKRSIAELLNFKTQIWKACDNHLVGVKILGMEPSKAKAYQAIINVLRQIPSARYEENTQTIAYRDYEKEFQEAAKIEDKGKEELGKVESPSTTNETPPSQGSSSEAVASSEKNDSGSEKSEIEKLKDQVKKLKAQLDAKQKTEAIAIDGIPQPAALPVLLSRGAKMLQTYQEVAKSTPVANGSVVPSAPEGVPVISGLAAQPAAVSPSKR